MDSLTEALNVVSTKRAPTNAGGNVEIGEQFFAKVADLGYNLDELRPFIECDKSMLGLSGAGAGKTTALVLKIIYEYITGRLYTDVEINGVVYKKPKKILVATFLKSGAEDLRRVLLEFCNKLGVTGMPLDCITFGTLHSEFYNAIKTMTGVSPKITTNQFGLVRSVMQTTGVRRRDSISPVLTNEEVMDIAGLITCYINKLDDETKYEHPIMAEYGINKTLLDSMVTMYRKMLSALDETDFDVMQEILYTNMCENDGIKEFIHRRYNVIFIDEFQDTSRLQYALLKEYIAGCERVIAIGDDDQCIYSWRGSDINIICKDFREDFNPEIRQLSVNYRCKGDILEAVIPCIERNSNRYDKQLKAAKSGGILELLEGVDGKELAERIIADSNKYTVGVISRTNNDLLVPAIYLELQGGIEYQLSSGISLSGKLVKTIFSSIELITKRYTDNFPAILKSLFKSFASRDVTKLCNVLKTNRQYNLFTVPASDLYASVPSVAEFILKLRDIRERAGDVAAFQALLYHYKSGVFTKDTPYHINGRNIATLLYKLFDEGGLLYNKDIYTIERLLLDELPKRIEARGKNSNVARVKLTTAHDAKGKEWDCVYVYNFNNKVFPSVMMHGSIAEYEEERRIAYIAWTRAKEKLVICTSVDMPSPFLKECNLGKCVKNAPLLKQVSIAKGKTPLDVVTAYCRELIIKNADPQLYELLGVMTGVEQAILDRVEEMYMQDNDGCKLQVGDITDELIKRGIDALYCSTFGGCDEEDCLIS